MCGRYTLRTSPQQMLLQFRLDTPVQADGGPSPLAALRPRYNIAPTQQVVVVREVADGKRELVEMRWGLVRPADSWPPVGAPLFNARSETAAEKPAFREAIRARRCLVPADGFYEWKAADRGRQPFYIHRPDEALLAFAGLWEERLDPQGRPLTSCTILTTDANALLRPLHDRMPVLVGPADYDAWLDPANTDPESIRPLFGSAPAAELVVTPVSPRVNAVANDDPQCLGPPERQGELFA
jgi:putative SOS response-associated peptidase YedK